MNAIQRLQDLVRDIAANQIMPYYLKVESARKADGSMLSQADLAAQKAFECRLPSIINAPVLGEEMTSAEQHALWHNAEQGLWVLDPIDGTNNFVNGIPHFAVSVAYVQNGRAQLGVVYNPVLQECFAAVRGQGAWLNGQTLPLRRIHKTLREAVAGVEIRRLRNGKLANSLNLFAPFGTLRSMGSSTLDWCYLAAGRYDVYVHGGQNLWDYAAGALIFEESGGLLATLEGDDFWSGKHAFQRSVIAAGQPALFEPWLAWIRKNQ
ncbi:inositol monophosphatase family protein [Kingella kingae]|uniref:Inositol monophosphatase n=2 Tax=Kingella kingae TaxID=504 RepID=F5S5W9_KINKI|nr:inositol monophosphatase family protein [Kingella kingae]EGK10448.1 inositol monophosphatase [Kingella kingae ATCC 23330]EIC14097.1 myo-inositol-1(or 4)-monophosphatase [Kingella kingae PYKK081]MBD3614453.1 inositol monophosphatase family protein [Kingella kingae]MBD3632732.1 inositol monophosphatase family protein [Kingella kingae]MBD3660095.1 inositol monophosphatase family protein [Kingella kingae]